MKKVLFYTVIAIFVATAVITLLGLVIEGLVREEYLDKLFYLLITEVVASVVGLFKATDFFGEENEQQDRRASIVMLPKDDFPRSSDPHNCSVTVFNRETGEEKSIDTQVVRENGYLSVFLDALLEEDLVKISIKNSASHAWESDYFSPSTIKAELERV